MKDELRISHPIRIQPPCPGDTAQASASRLEFHATSLSTLASPTLAQRTHELNTGSAAAADAGHASLKKPPAVISERFAFL